MIYKCSHCFNENQEKFTTTPKGFICLVCYEKKVIGSPENEMERAAINIKDYLSRGTGGNTRRFARAYKSMKDKYLFLETLPDKTEAQFNFTKGFLEAIKTFENEANNA